ncbi:MAG: cell wall hydrolase [Lachnospiraceae bacterium]|nr:cell wall hydrolase [Lachnospiraceae bacterium]
MIKRVGAFILILSVSFTVIWSDVYAKNSTSDKIKEAQKKIESLEEDKEEAEQQASSLQSEANAIEGELKELNDSLQSVTDAITSLENQISEKETDISDATARLAAAEETKAKQYEDMKKRIRFMYERSNDDILSLFLESESISDFLNSVEYIKSISDYDREKLDEYKETCEIITTEKSTLETEQANLVALEEEQQEKKSELDTLVANTQNSLSETNSELAEAQSKADALALQIEEMEALEAELEKQKAEEDKKRLEELKKQEEELKKQTSSGTTTAVTVTSSDQAMLAAIIYCEAGGESYEGQVAVGSVVMNRVASNYYPNTISGVIYQSGQFSPVASGRFAAVLSGGLASSSAASAAAAVIGGTRNVSALSFRNVSSGISGTVIGNHVFF